MSVLHDNEAYLNFQSDDEACISGIRLLHSAAGKNTVESSWCRLKGIEKSSMFSNKYIFEKT